MGHYDDCYEAEYAKEREERRAAVKRDIPLIIEDLQGAAERLRCAVGYVDNALRIESDIQFAIAALRGQLGA